MWSSDSPIVIPKHIAIIPDGNRRFLSKTGGILYTKSGEVLQNIVDWSLEKGVQELSIFAWSSENWSRPRSEITRAMEEFAKVLTHWLEKEQNEIAYYFISTSPMKLNSTIREKMQALNQQTRANTKLIVYIYVSYGFSEDVQRPQLSQFKLSSAVPSFASNPDLLIRTSGEHRLSNFCMWHLAYTELLFIDPLFPECDSTTWNFCAAEYSRRKRRFGK